MRLTTHCVGAGDGIRTRNPQLGNVIRRPFVLNTYRLFQKSLANPYMHSAHTVPLIAIFATRCGTFAGQQFTSCCHLLVLAHYEIETEPAIISPILPLLFLTKYTLFFKSLCLSYAKARIGSALSNDSSKTQCRNRTVVSMRPLSPIARPVPKSIKD